MTRPKAGPFILFNVFNKKKHVKMGTPQRPSLFFLACFFFQFSFFFFADCFMFYLPFEGVWVWVYTKNNVIGTL